jgi:hypothetical protein
MAGTVGVAPGSYTFTLPTGQTITIEDWIDDKLYSTVQLANGQTSAVEAYTSGRGQPIAGGSRVQTDVDTNTPRAGDNGLPMAWEAFIYSVCVQVVRAMRGPTATPTQPTLADGSGAFSDPPLLRTLFNIDRVTFCYFFYNTRPYTYGTFVDYPSGVGYTLFTTNATTELSNNGVPSPRDRQSMVLPIWLRENIGFRFPFEPKAPLVIAQAASDGGDDLTFVDVKVRSNGLVKRSAGL